MIEEMQCNMEQNDFPVLQKWSIEWFVLNGWDKPEAGFALTWGTVWRATFIGSIGMVAMAIPYSVVIIKEICFAWDGWFLDILAAIIDVFIVAWMAGRSWKGVLKYQSKIVEKYKKAVLMNSDLEDIYRLKKICKMQSFAFFGVLISAVILILTAFVPIISSAMSCGPNDAQDVAAILGLLKKTQHQELIRNYLLYSFSFGMFMVLAVVAFPISTFFDLLVEDLDHILNTREYTRIYMVLVKENKD